MVERFTIALTVVATVVGCCAISAVLSEKITPKPSFGFDFDEVKCDREAAGNNVQYSALVLLENHTPDPILLTPNDFTFVLFPSDNAHMHFGRSEKKFFTLQTSAIVVDSSSGRDKAAYLLQPSGSLWLKIQSTDSSALDGVEKKLPSQVGFKACQINYNQNGNNFGMSGHFAQHFAQSD